MHKGSAYRPQANFLPLAPRRGIVETLPIKPSRRYEREQRLKKEQKDAAAASVQEPVVPIEIPAVVTV